ncbi:hypothetical protein C4B68_37845 [Streptomyces dengpaensis]|uniref:Uncharacterized protein n=1 Tax=Streptomyces dengpaensis TaxID=2049881 RepID=A0ABN5IBP2_9ACTN|nr:hypothetical protein C4B68_37845 [Streptomyces dengpaensis]PIB04439.1 hypothetical protein B1C81_33100 [Streptomyces sp. HG99]
MRCPHDGWRCTFCQAPAPGNASGQSPDRHSAPRPSRASASRSHRPPRSPPSSRARRSNTCPGSPARAIRRRQPGPYQLQAAIVACHAEAARMRLPKPASAAGR